MILSVLIFTSGFFANASINTNQYQDLKKIAFSEAKEMNQRWKAIVELSKIPHQDRKKDLLEALNSKVWFMRNASLLALDTVDKNEARKAATRLLADPSLVVRSAAVEVLAPHLKNSSDVRNTLWTEFKDKQNVIKSRSLWIRPQILKHLAQAPTMNEAEIFADLAASAEPEISEIASEALKKIK